MCLIRIRPEIDDTPPVRRQVSRAGRRSRPPSAVIITSPPPPPPASSHSVPQVITAYPNGTSTYAGSAYAPSIVTVDPPPVIQMHQATPTSSAPVVTTIYPDGRKSMSSVRYTKTRPIHRRRHSGSSSTSSLSSSSSSPDPYSPRASVISSSRSREYHAGGFYPDRASHLSVGHEGDKGGRRRSGTVGSNGGYRSSFVGGGGHPGRASHRSVRSYGGEGWNPRLSEKIVVTDEWGRRVEY